MAYQTKSIRGKKISQPNAFKKGVALEKQDSSRIFTKANVSCSYWGGTSKKSYREWTNAKELLTGGTAQCGSAECCYGGEGLHIGSPTGDIPRPALLHISDFDRSFLENNAKIDHIEVSFDYLVVNTYNNGKVWTSNIAENEKAVIQGVDVWFGNTSKITTVQHNSTKMKYEGKNSKGKYIWKSLSFKFTDLTAAEILGSNFALNIQYGMNCSKASTPCRLYMKGLSISIKYENSTKYIEGYNNVNSLYTSNDTNCDTQITQTVIAGDKSGSTKTPKYGNNIILKSYPKGVTVTKIKSNANLAQFLITDKTNTPGDKIVSYCLSDDKKTIVNIHYTAVVRNKPSYEIVEEYKSGEDFDENKAYIIFKDGCASSIKIYIDSIDSTPLGLSVSNQNSKTNLLSQETIKTFHSAIKSLSCGTHTLYIQRGNETKTDAIKNKVSIRIIPMEFRFQIYSDDNPSLIYNQTKADNESTGETRHRTIKIKRVDDEPCKSIPSLEVLDETNITSTNQTLENVKKGDVLNHSIDLYYSGEFYIKILDKSSKCVSSNPSTARIWVNSRHRQNYDYIFTRAENGTAIDVDYLVAWEGDNIRVPIKTQSMVLKHSPNDIRLCSDDVDIGLSQVGLVELKISNRTDNEVFKNLKIELNTLIDGEEGVEVTTDEWIEASGIFYNFYNLFIDYNQSTIDNLFIENLTPDNNLIDEENVYLGVKYIAPGDTITVYLPYRSTVEKTVYLQFLLFEQPHPIYHIGDCNSVTAFTNDMITINVSDSMQTQIEIEGDTDLLSLDDTIPCPDECYTTTGITYKITNIDTNDFNQQYVKTIINNSPEIEPIACLYNGVRHPLSKSNNIINATRDVIVYDTNGNVMYDEDNNPITETVVTHNILTWSVVKKHQRQSLANQLIYCYAKFPSLSNKISFEKTNSKGYAHFYIEIPPELNRSYTATELLSEVLYFSFKGKGDYNPVILAGTNNPFKETVEHNDAKYDTFLNYDNNYRRYQPGEKAHIAVLLSVDVPITYNTIDFNALLGDNNTSDEITILYKICNLPNNEGVLRTSFATNDKLLIKQETYKDIYCGIDTDVQTYTKLEKRIVESQNLNMLYIDVHNKNKINQNVMIVIDMGQYIDYQGTYDFLDIDIDVGDYAISIEENKTVVTWQIGEMQPDQVNKGIIKIQAQHIGLSDIKINTFDYLHTPTGDVPLKQSKCVKCPNEPISYIVKDHKWDKIDGKWYKKINGIYYEKVIDQNNNIKWVEKNDD